MMYYYLNSNRKKFIVSFNIGTHGSYKQEFNKEWLQTIGEKILNDKYEVTREKMMKNPLMKRKKSRR